MTTMDHVKDQAQEQAGVLAGRAKGLIVGQIDERSTQIGQTLTGNSQTIREIGDQLRERGETPAARLADTAADKLEQFGYYLTETDGERLVADLENLARRQPLLTLAAGLTLGLLAARLLKASASERYAYYGQRRYTEEFNDRPSSRNPSLRYYED